MIRSQRDGWRLVAILLLAFAVRLLGSSDWPVWTDEGWSIWATDDPNPTQIVAHLAQDRHPPLYFLALGLWREVAGDSRLALRWLSLAAGLLTVAVTYRIGALVFGRRAAWGGALLLAILPLAAYYSQEVRHYGWFTLTVGLMWFFWLRLHKYPTFGKMLGYMLSLAAASYTLYFAVIPLALQVILTLIVLSQTRHWRLGYLSLAAWGGALLLYVPWLSVIVTIQWPTLTSGISGFPGTYTATLANALPVAELLLGPQVALLLALLGLGLWGILRPNGLRSPFAAGSLVAGGLGLALGLFLLSIRFDLLAGRTLVFVTPLLMILAGYGLSLLDRRGQVALVSALLVVTLAAPPVIQPRLNSDETAQLLSADYSVGDLIVLETGWDDNAFAYEIRRLLPDAHIIRTLSRADIYSDEKDLLPALRPLLDEQRRIWVVQWLQAPQIMPWLDSPESGFERILAHERPVAPEYSQRFGPSTIHLTLYARPDRVRVGWQYGEWFTLHDAIAVDRAAPGQSLHVDLWWSARQPVPLDYSVGVFLLDATGAVRVEQNGPPGSLPTSQWTPSQWMHDRHSLRLPPDLPPGAYTLVVNAYWFGDNQPLLVDGQPFQVIGRLDIVAK